MAQQLRQQRVGLPHARLARSLAQPDTQRQCVDEEAQHALGAGRLACGRTAPCRTPHRPGPRRGQHLRPGQVAQAGGADAERPACSRSRLARPASSATTCLGDIPEPSPCTSARPNGAVGSSTSPSIVRKNASCSSRTTPSRAWATKLRNGSGAATVRLGPEDAPGFPPAAHPAWCGPSPDGGTDSASPSARSPHRGR